MSRFSPKMTRGMVARESTLDYRFLSDTERSSAEVWIYAITRILSLLGGITLSTQVACHRLKSRHA